jgi:hypothetical protein
MKLLANGAIYVVAYLLFMLPTYALPYLGSNSAVINTLSVAAAGKTYPLFWYHATALAVLVALTLLRGPYVGRRWLWVFPTLAAFFDLMPGINMIPLAPTLLHVFAVVLGVMDSKKAPAEGEAAAVPGPTRTETLGAAAIVGAFALISIVTTVTYGPRRQSPPMQAPTVAGNRLQAPPQPMPPARAAPQAPAVQSAAAPPSDVRPVPAPAAGVGGTRFSGVVDRMTVDVLLDVRGDGTVAGHWQVTNRPNLAGIRYRLEGVRRGGAWTLKEFSATNAYEMDVHLRADPATGELVGEARNLAPGSKAWAVRLKPT